MEKSVLMVPKEVHTALKKYCAGMHWPMVHAATVAINAFLEAQRDPEHQNGEPDKVAFAGEGDDTV